MQKPKHTHAYVQVHIVATTALYQLGPTCNMYIYMQANCKLKPSVESQGIQYVTYALYSGEPSVSISSLNVLIIFIFCDFERHPCIPYNIVADFTI